MHATQATYIHNDTSIWNTFTERAMSGWNRLGTVTLPTALEDGSCKTPDSTDEDIRRSISSLSSPLKNYKIEIL